MLEKNTLVPAFEQNNIPVFFSADDNYILYAGVAIQSIIANASPDYNYDICILYEKLDRLNIERILAFRQKNVSIRFFNILDYIGNERQNISYERAHFTVAMYYRIFIADIFKCFDKALYLDCDIIVQKDVGDLFFTDLDDYYLAAVPDFGALEKDNKIFSPDYINNVLHVDKRTYFNSGVLVLNCKNIRNERLKDKCLELLGIIKKPKAPDQDILNSACFKKVKLLPLAWNFETSLPNHNPLYEQTIYEEYKNDFQQALHYPFIIHYTGHEKPWNFPEIRSADLFWKYARMTAYYELLLARCAAFVSAQEAALIKQKNKIYIQLFKYAFLSKLPFKRKQKRYLEKLTKLRHKAAIIKRLS